MRVKSDDQIRLRLIRSLGINHSSKSSTYSQMMHSSKQKNILTARTQEIPLKNHCRNKTAPKADSKIQFNSVVKAMPIPSHQDYSNRVKRLIWSNGTEIRQNAQRNAREFAFEGWSAQYVLEEDQMYLDVGSMEFIHPVHVVGYS
eukprot:CAMPEP_0168165210 /NCGR_PEP_ID=MMETSP0139_2-20121125/1365_1 /TAXON_ID=44445 /ORGANISM="Pseudo-nitzschia australis, Strain 10249 10 AB" /LENGTH=144 /DNA_ID=CAMNT_0008082311 /DNA_START=187 /DNA_END=621 /DNA_ORIENTATION=-